MILSNIILASASIIFGGSIGFHFGFQSAEKVNEEYTKDLKHMIDKAIKESDGELLKKIKNNWDLIA